MMIFYISNLYSNNSEVYQFEDFLEEFIEKNQQNFDYKMNHKILIFMNLQRAFENIDRQSFLKDCQNLIDVQKIFKQVEPNEYFYKMINTFYRRYILNKHRK